jgi:hypothetical protein
MELSVGPYIPEDGRLGVGPFVPVEGAQTITFAGHQMPSEFGMVFHLLLPPGEQKSDGTRGDRPDSGQVRTVLTRGSVEIRFVGGRPRCHSLVVDYSRDGVDSGTLRAIPLAELIRVAVMMGSSFMKGGPSPLRRSVIDDIVWDINTALTHRRERLNPNVVAAAQIYREALMTGRKPGPMIAARLHVTPESARRLVQQARQARLLGASLGQGRLGEQTPLRGEEEDASS